MDLKETIKGQLKSGEKFFYYNGDEWKLEFEDNTSFIEKIINKPVIIFANNGYGDYLFIEKDSPQVYEYFHEIPEINKVDEDFKILMGIKKAPPSKDDYPVAIYKTGEKIKPGDRVMFKVWFEFWKGWQEGEVTYVPGISNKKNQYEYGGLKYIEVKGKGVIMGQLVCHETGIVKKIRLVSRKK